MTILAVICLPKFLQCVHYPWHLIAFLGVYQRTDSFIRGVAKTFLSLFPEMLSVSMDPPGLDELCRT